MVDLPVVDDPILESPNCQDPYSGQYPYNETSKPVAAAGDGEPEHNGFMDSGPKEDTDVICAPRSRGNNGSHSPHMAPAPAVAAPQESVAATDSQAATPAPNPSITVGLNGCGRPQQAAEVADGKQAGARHSRYRWHGRRRS
jgi:hypothetical protein